ncbi:rod shape-determining protein [Spirillospora albida]|uniref:rod shape-determining protein n=1 Tax=Spirillospora albida TaxID=58123 RepID=UPI00068CFA85|nr:rod shape-determining protein [Spirillospora albida]
MSIPAGGAGIYTVPVRLDAMEGDTGMWTYAGRDTAIDLGSSTVRMHVAGRGIVCREPSVLARSRRTGRILALGTPALEMAGRDPDADLVRPVREGAPTDTDEVEYLMRRLVRRHLRRHYTARPRLVVTVPSGVNSVYARALEFSAYQAGARRVTLVPVPVAAAAGMGLITGGRAVAVVADIGAELTDVGVIAFGGLVTAHTVAVGGTHLDRAIAALARQEFGVALSPAEAEAAKLAVGTAPCPGRRPVRAVTVHGRDVETGLPRPVELTTRDVQGAIAKPVEEIVEAIRAGLRGCAPEIAGDLLSAGISLTGGSSRLPGLDRLIGDRTGLTAVVRDPTGDAAVIGAAEVHRAVGDRPELPDPRRPLARLTTSVPQF